MHNRRLLDSLELFGGANCCANVVGRRIAPVRSGGRRGGGCGGGGAERRPSVMLKHERCGHEKVIAHTVNLAFDAEAGESGVEHLLEKIFIYTIKRITVCVSVCVSMSVCVRMRV